jgi:hypothetical protein
VRFPPDPGKQPLDRKQLMTWAKAGIGISAGKVTRQGAPPLPGAGRIRARMNSNRSLFRFGPTRTWQLPDQNSHGSHPCYLSSFWKDCVAKLSLRPRL